jgi:hypothetical protein
VSDGHLCRRQEHRQRREPTSAPLFRDKKASFLEILQKSALNALIFSLILLYELSSFILPKSEDYLTQAIVLDAPLSRQTGIRAVLIANGIFVI